MQFVIKNKSKENIASLLRRAGYRFLGRDDEKKEMAFVRFLGLDGYPRFHIYIKSSEPSQKIFLNLHLDQRRPVYKGAPAHCADYEGLAVEEEMERIKQFLQELD